ncbi:LacI family DNA-binding transcriptional regulator [Pollutimonas bauzanensis]|uniref:Transcriptional regulator, LacI family n=1 Tax=Pollutimonas bauzanensis TaxID=658167 RepID=A0A1M5MIA8_9BURK|nr:substrate-binding domain-containing protein [Pollutimonas bauzanensis]SHG77164.1 transcriptional regulator, LacI family [Pollutimonas bauzanensis]
MARVKKVASQSSPARITVQEVADLAGVSIGTVSRVINNVPGVKPAVIKKVQGAIDELGWSPNIAAQNIRTSSSRMIGFIFSDIRNSLYSSMTKGAEEVLSTRGYLLVTASSDGNPEREVVLIDFFKRRRADGMILTIQEENNNAVLAAIANSGIPHVMMEREIPMGSISIGADHFRGTRQAVQYLLGLGHRRIALITGGRGTRVARDRIRALEEALASAGIEPDPNLFCIDSFAAEYGLSQTQRLMNMKEPPTALLSMGVRLLPGVLEALQLLGKKIPDDLSLICSNDTDIARIVTPQITAVRYDALALGRMAAESLIDQIEKRTHEDRPVRIEIPTELILRNSCRAISS